MADWLADQVFYEIFPDRFAIGSGGDVRAKRSHLPADASLRRWNQRPAEPPHGRDWFGGDLAGIVEHLDHVTSLGATALYLTPVFTAASNHRYDAIDFRSVDPALGGDGALVALLDACRARGLRVVLDAVLNHVSDRHPWVRAGTGLLQRDGIVQRWRGFGHMPELDLRDPFVRGELIEGDDALLGRWVARGAAGWRLDVAADLEPPFVRDITRAVKHRAPDACVIAEVMSFPAGWMGRDGDADGVMNYYARRALLDWIADPRATSPAAVARAVTDVIDACGLPATLRSWMMLASHDTPRALDACGDAARARVATTVQFTLPGAPVVYYGEEVGLRGAHDPANRAPMPWSRSRWDGATLAHHRALCALRRASPALRRGAFLDLTGRTGEGVLAYLRYTEDPRESVLVVAHTGDAPRVLNLHLPHGPLRDGVRFVDRLGAPPHPDVYLEAGRVRVTLGPCEARVFGVDADYIANYRFYDKR